MTHTFTIERSDADPNDRHVVTRDDKPHGGRILLFAGRGPEVELAMEAVRQAYHLGRVDEAAIRAAALSGLTAGRPLS